METYDLRTLRIKDHATPKVRRPLEPPDFQCIALKRWTFNEANEYYYYLATPDNPEMTRLWEDKSLKYASHSNHFGIVGPHLLQLSLAICLKLYTVSRSIRDHKEFAGKFLISLPDGKFVKQIIVPI